MSATCLFRFTTEGVLRGHCDRCGAAADLVLWDNEMETAEEAVAAIKRFEREHRGCRAAGAREVKP